MGGMKRIESCLVGVGCCERVLWGSIVLLVREAVLGALRLPVALALKPLLCIAQRCERGLVIRKRRLDANAGAWLPPMQVLSLALGGGTAALMAEGLRRFGTKFTFTNYVHADR